MELLPILVLRNLRIEEVDFDRSVGISVSLETTARRAALPELCTACAICDLDL